MKKEKLITLSNYVKEVLFQNTKAREDDFVLYSGVIKSMGIKLPIFRQLTYVLNNHSKYGLPPFESVTRARRKVCELYPELKGNNNDGRISEEVEYKEFSKVGNI